MATVKPAGSRFRNLKDQLTPALVRRIAEGYSSGDFRKDLIAGLTVGVVALPLAMAFSIGAGGTPAQGLYTAIIAGFVIAALGGSFHQVSGPTGAFVVIIAQVIAEHGMSGLFLATLIAGLLLIFMGLSGLGSLIKYIPYPVTIGFTTGIGVIIFVGQIKDLFGLQMPALSPEFFGKLEQYAEYLPTLTIPAMALGLGTVILIALIRKLLPKLPAAVTAVAIVTAAAFLLGLPVETIGSKFGALPKGFPLPKFPDVDLTQLRKVFPSGLTIALLAAIESLLSAVVADGMTGTRHSASAELTAQGLGNIASVFFGGIPATGAIARTATNIKAGARSPVAAIIHAAVLLVFTLFLGPVVQAIPLAALAGVLTVVAFDMSELPRFISMRKAPKSDLLVMLTTFILTVVVDLTAAVQVGVLLAIVLFVRRASATTSMSQAAGIIDGDAARSSDKADAFAIAARAIPEGCEVYEINGPFFFGVADMLQDALAALEKAPRAFVLRMRRVPAVDATGLNALRTFSKRCRHHGTVVILSGVTDQPKDAMTKYGLLEEIGAENVCPEIDAALERVRQIIATPREHHVRHSLSGH